MAEERTLEGMAQAAADFPDYAAGEWFVESEARAMARKEAFRKAEEWCRNKRSCEKGTCHVLDVETEVLDQSVTQVKEAGEGWGAVKFYAIKLKITAVRCTCRDVNPVLVRPKQSEEPEPISFKDELRKKGLSDAQIAKLEQSKCLIQLMIEVKKDGETEKRVTSVICDSGIDEQCEKGKACALILYKIGDDTDPGAPQTTPYDLSTLPEGCYLSCECR